MWTCRKFKARPIRMILKKVSRTAISEPDVEVCDATAADKGTNS